MYRWTDELMGEETDRQTDNKNQISERQQLPSRNQLAAPCRKKTDKGAYANPGLSHVLCLCSFFLFSERVVGH